MAAIGSVTLPDNLYWADEFTDWEPVAQASEYALNGAQVVEEGARLAGRPITLQGLWLPRATVLALDALAAAPGATYTLTLPDAQTFTVRFRRADGRAIEARPLFPRAAPAAETLYETTIRLMEA